MADYRRERIKKYIRDYKSSHSCECGEKDVSKLTFHHRNPLEKEFDIADAPRVTHSLERVAREISKCMVICRDCHDEIHGNTSNAREDIFIPLLSSPKFKSKGRIVRFSLDA